MSTPFTRRLRSNHNAAEEGDIAKGMLGEEFEEAPCLLLSEVKLLLQTIEEQREKRQQQNLSGEQLTPDTVPLPIPNTEIYHKAKQHVELFSKFHDAQSVASARNIASHGAEFANYQLVQLANLLPSDVDEAVALIPSLADHDPQEVAKVIEGLANLQRFQV